VEISEKSEEISLALDAKGLVAALEEVADPPVTPVEPLTVEGLEGKHDAGECHRATLQREVDVIAHQAVGVDAELETFSAHGEPLQVDVSILVIAEDGLALVPARDHVINTTGDIQA
jgi:hypothetical protein